MDNIPNSVNVWYIDDIRKSVCSACICSAETCAGLPCAEEKMVSYNRLWETMEKRKISQYRLIKEFGLSSGQMSRLKKNTYVSTHTLETLWQDLRLQDRGCNGSFLRGRKERKTGSRTA